MGFDRWTVAVVALCASLPPLMVEVEASEIRLLEETQNPKIWRTTPIAGRCNGSQAENLAARSGLLFPHVIGSDENEVVVEGKTIDGDLEILRFRNVRGCRSRM